MYLGVEKDTEIGLDNCEGIIARTSNYVIQISNR